MIAQKCKRTATCRRVGLVREHTCYKTVLPGYRRHVMTVDITIELKLLSWLNKTQLISQTINQSIEPYVKITI